LWKKLAICGRTAAITASLSASCATPHQVNSQSTLISSAKLSA
jgi:hypothetical protein